MKINLGKLPFIIFLKTIKYICYTVLVTWRHIYLNIHGICKYPRNQAPNTGYYKTCYVDPIIEIGIRQQKISEHNHTFWYVLHLVRVRNPGPLHFDLMRFHCRQIK